VSRTELFSRHPWSPLEGRRIHGRVEATIRRGEVVFRDGAVCGAPGSGSFLTAEPAAQAAPV
jgi:dihydropyrimidinase